MLFLPESVYKEIDRLIQKVESGKSDRRAAAERILTLLPEEMQAYMWLWQCCAGANDDAGSEAWLWRGMGNSPLDPTLYLAMGFQRRRADPEDIISRRLLEMCYWKVGLAEELPPGFAEIHEESAGKSPLDFSRPASFSLLASAMQAHREEEEEEDPPEVVAKLLPFQLITDLQRQANDEVDPRLLDQFREHAARVVPLLQAAIRGWARLSIGTAPALSMIAAMLGEIGSPEDLADLLELSQRSEPPLFLHVHWAIFRIVQRFPEAGLAALRSMIPRADVGMRCAIGEQLSLMAPIPGLEAAFQELLDGFAKSAKQPEASYLLLSVVRGLDALGQEGPARELQERYLPLLTQKDRKWYREFDIDDFVPTLVEEAIDELSLEDVCLSRELMDESDEEEDYEDADEDEDDEDEDVEPELVRPGRNDPCWCGSGKKYKKCHLDADEAGDRQRVDPAPDKKQAPQAPSNPAALELIPQVLESIPRAVSAQAMETYFQNDPPAIFDDPEQQQLFIQWLLFDFRLPANGRTPVEEFLHRRSRNLSQPHRRQLEAWQESRLSLVEVQRVEEGRGIEVKDLLAGGVFFINDVTSSKSNVVWDCILSRIERHGDRHEFSGNGLNVQRDILPDFLEWIETERRKKKLTATDFLAANSHRLHRVLRELDADRLDSLQVVNNAGEPIAFCRAVYKVSDEAAVRTVLRDLPELAGDVTIDGGLLTLEADSEERLERGRRLLELQAGKWLTHVEDKVTSLDDLKRTAMEAPVEPAAKEVPAEVEYEIVSQYKQQHYAAWLDDSLPALGGKTPREAARTREGRKALETVLRSIENTEDRCRRRGDAAYDVSILRRELDL